MEHQLLSTLGIVFTLGMLSQWIAWKFRFPVIILFTGFGILVGPVFGIINPKAAFGPMLHPMVELAVAMILFEGGLLLKFHEFEKTAKGTIAESFIKENKHHNNDNYENAKDWLIISCYTGQRISDFMRFGKSMIRHEKNKQGILNLRNVAETVSNKYRFKINKLEFKIITY